MNGFEKVKFKFEARGPYTTNLTKYKGFAYPPENSRGNPDLQYFEMHIDDQLHEEQTLFFKARGTLLPEKSDDERAKHAAPSIFWTIVIGVLMTLVCTGSPSSDSTVGRMHTERSLPFRQISCPS